MSGVVSTPAIDRIGTVTPLVVSVFALAIFLAALGIAWWTKNENLGILLGVAASNATTVVSYWLGSSSGSKTKDSVIASQTMPSPGTTTTTVTPATITTMGTLR